MKQIFTFLAALLLGIGSAAAQDIAGLWYGILKAPGIELGLMLQFEPGQEGYKAALQSPVQQTGWMPASSFTLESSALTLEIASVGMRFTGTVQEGKSIEGTFTQSGLTIPLAFFRTREEAIAEAAAKQPSVRPQDPQPPFPYREEEVKFSNPKANITLAGTLTLPEGRTPATAVVLISGSGAQNRDCEVFNHRPFAVIADHLTRAGVAVLRVDDRGVGQSQGDYAAATVEDFADDAGAAVEYLKTRPEIDPQKVGLIGQSQGGYNAFMLAARMELPFIVTLAGPGVNGTDLVLMQKRALLKAQGATEEFLGPMMELQVRIIEVAKSGLSSEEMEQRVQELTTGTPVAGQASSMLAQLNSPELISFLKYDPAEDMRRITCPVLALNGEKDLQVPALANLTGIYEGITAGGNPNVTVKAYPGLNHLFQTAGTGLPAEYGQIEETFNAEALKDMAEWLKAR